MEFTDFPSPKKFRTTKTAAPIAKRFATVFIVISIIVVALNIILSFYFNPKTVVERELDALAREYYEDYLYQNLIGSRTGDAVAEELQRYNKSGVSNTYLRQLLLYDSGRRQDAGSYFDQKGYTCDRNQTYVKYYPDPPYTNTDYHFDIKLVCE